MSTKQLNQLVELLQLHPPPFIFIHNPLNARPAPSSLLQSLKDAIIQCMGICIDCNEIFTSKTLFHVIINELTSSMPELDAKGKAVSWSNEQVSKWDRSLDSFLECLKAAYEDLKRTRRWKEDVNLVLLFEHAERLKETLSALFVPLTRLRELVQIPVTTVFISSAPWNEISLSLGIFSEPYLVSVIPQSKHDVIIYLNSLFPKAISGSSTSRSSSDAYDPLLKPLYSTFLGVLYDACTPYTTDPDDLAYLAYAMWPSFVRPVLEDWWAEEACWDGGTGGKDDEGDEDGSGSNEERQRKPQGQRMAPPDSAAPLLIRQFLVSFQSGFPALYSRSISATSFLHTQASQPSFRLSQRFSASSMANINASLSASPPRTSVGLDGTQNGTNFGTSLSKQKKLLLVAAYVSSFNPARTDLRMFGRVAEGVTKKGRARRTGGVGTGKSLSGRKAAKVPQVLLGPNSFTLERLLAIYGAFVVEHGDGHTDPAELQPGEVEVEVHRATVLMMLTELIQLRLITRVGQLDRLDNNVMLKCNVGFDLAESFAKEMNLNLSELLWDPLV